MRLTTLVSLGLCLTILGASAAVGHSPNPNGSCGNVGDEATTIPVEGVGEVSGTIAVEGVATLYVTGVDDTLATTPSLWLESNDWPGLQTHEHTCRTTTTGDTSIGADSQLL